MTGSDAEHDAPARQRLEALFADQHEAVARYVRRRTRPEFVDDVVAETFLVACRRADTIPNDPLPWLLAVARRVLATQHRSAQRRLALTTKLATTTPAPMVASDPESTRVRDALEKLSDSGREAITLIAWDGLTPAQAAAALGTSRVAFRARLSRARRRLQKCLKEPEPGLSRTNSLTSLTPTKEETTL